ncbi:MAG TPA: ribonuclease R [Thermotogota bacterium]|nr:ribonuclease R [Thermotogota bacterium]HRW91324.1 ribonuclease R [Thermotogota bacterium]
MPCTEKEILEIMTAPDYRPMLLKELYKKCNAYSKLERKDLRELLKALQTRGRIAKDARNRYLIPAQDQPVGRIEFVRSGNMGFVKTPDGNEYVVFIENAKSAMHRDLVQIKPTGFFKEWKRANVVKILERNLSKVAGVLVREGKLHYVVPDDRRINLRFAVPIRNQADLKGATPGEKVIAQITRYPSPGSYPTVAITQALGAIDDPAVHLPSVIVKHSLPFPDEFPPSVSQEVPSVPGKVRPMEKKGRKDYTNLLTFTIDGEDAKDFDDAVSLELLENGNYMLYVHIADVGHYVTENSAIDLEARKRATSTYLVNTVIPMLPFELSSGICSLKQGCNRLVVTLEMEIDPHGELVDFRAKEGMIRSRRRLTYRLVNQFLEEKKASARRSLNKTPGLLTCLEKMEELAQILRQNRKKRGAIIEIESGEVEVVLDEKGHTKQLIPRKRNISESIIEEFMIRANEVVAQLFFDAQIPFIYRIHEQPDPETLSQLKQYIRALGIEQKVPQTLNSFHIQKLLEGLKEHPLRNSVERLVVRSMKRAVYHETNIGHYGLASEAYTHFTSPIRRYPDLVVHRLLKEYLHGEIFENERNKEWEAILPSIARDCSRRERVSNEAEWDLIALKKVDYVSRNLSEIFQVVITNVSKFGLFVEIPEISVPGLVHISTLNDFYIYDEQRNMLVGERTKNIFKLGDILKTRVKDIDFVRGEIDFELVD